MRDQGKFCLITFFYEYVTILLTILFNYVTSDSLQFDKKNSISFKEDNEKMHNGNDENFINYAKTLW